MPHPVIANITIAMVSIDAPTEDEPGYSSMDGQAASVSATEVTSAVGQLRWMATVSAATKGRPPARVENTETART